MSLYYLDFDFSFVPVFIERISLIPPLPEMGHDQSLIPYKYDTNHIININGIIPIPPVTPKIQLNNRINTVSAHPPLCAQEHLNIKYKHGQQQTTIEHEIKNQNIIRLVPDNPFVRAVINDSFSSSSRTIQLILYIIF